MRLNIIGNGFDLYHGLPSSYYYFGCFLATNYPVFYREMSDMYGFQCYKMTGYEDYETAVSDLFWKTFEEQLGYLDDCWMEGRLLDDLGLECDDPVDLDIPERVNSGIIKEKFREWVCTTVNTKQNFDIVKSAISRNKCRFRRDDYFVNFNYTQTLREVYGVPHDRIIHIHGECELDEDCSDLIVGHGNSKHIYDIDQKIIEIERGVTWLGLQSERNRLNEYKCEKAILQDLIKDVSYLSSNLIRQLRNKELQVEEIKVWGLSCGPVDEKYIEALQRNYPDASWKFSFYSDAEKKSRADLAKRLGISKVGYFKFLNPNSKKICEEIVLENRITEYEKI